MSRFKQILETAKLFRDVFGQVIYVVLWIWAITIVAYCAHSAVSGGLE